MDLLLVKELATYMRNDTIWFGVNFRKNKDSYSKSVFLNRRAAAQCRALASLYRAAKGEYFIVEIF
jgi:hypothetical protein